MGTMHDPRKYILEKLNTCPFCGADGRLMQHWKAATCDEGFQGEPGWAKARRLELERRDPNPLQEEYLRDRKAQP